MIWNRFSSVTTTSFRTGSTAMELKLGYGSWMNRAGGRAATAIRALASGSCAAAAPAGAYDMVCGAATSHSHVSPE
jgi:hypothetical protein